MITFHYKIQCVGQPDITGVLSAEPQRIGRASDSDILLADDAISRRHAELYTLHDQVHIRDLESSNGVFLNGTRVSDSVLTPSDRVYLGSYSLRIEAVTTFGEHGGGAHTILDYEEVGPIHQRLVDKDHSAVSFLYRFSQRIAPHRTMEALFGVILEEVMEVFPADRGFVLSSAGIANICVSKSRKTGGDDPPISQTLVAHVQETRSSVLTTDAASDERFETSDSIAAHNIKAAMCVPLLSHERVLGVIYVDRDSSCTCFTSEHLQLLSIVGHVAGTAVENAYLTERQIHQERLAAIGQTVSATSHDMRNIIVGISGGTELLELAHEKQRWDRAEKATRIIKNSLERFENLLNSLLTCARKSTVCLESTDVDPLLREVIESFEPEAQKYGVSLTLNHQLTCNVPMDGPQIYRVLTNLIKNAIEVMQSTGGTIRIESYAEGTTNIIRVSDTGPGILPEHLSQLGQTFFTTKSDGGTGLGLAVSYQIMAQHGGQIRVESSPGAGASFLLEFPELSKQTVRLSRMTA